MASPRMPRPLDHLVLPVADLDVARARHQALGFTVAPAAQHPFGTENACIFFADGTYLEPLAIASREGCEAAAIAGNVFVARDQAFRFRNGQEGLSAFVVGSQDAHADHLRFEAAGLSGGPMLEFARVMTGADGVAADARFRLAFAADLRSPDFYTVAVERVQVPALDRSALIAHENGVTGIAEVVLTEQNPTDFQYFLQEVANNRAVEAHSFGMSIALDGARISVLTPEGFDAWYGGTAGEATRGLRGRAVVFSVADLPGLAARLQNTGIAMRRIGGHILVDAASGQGAIYAFKDMT